MRVKQQQTWEMQLTLFNLKVGNLCLQERRLNGQIRLTIRLLGQRVLLRVLLIRMVQPMM